MSNKISIIVPVYKVEKYLSKCIESILNQSFKDFELILVNDGSPDNCRKICETYAENDRRIKIINKENGGLSSARNAGIDVAKGEYLAFIDSDDYIHHRMYEFLYKNAKKYSSDIAICDYLLINEGVEFFLGDTPDFNVAPQTFSNIKALEQIYTNNGTKYIVAWNKLYRRSLFNHLRFKEGKIHEDEFLVHRVLYNSSKVIYFPIPLYYYLQRSDSITGSKFTIRNLDAMDAIEDRIKFFSNINQKSLRQKTEYNYIIMLFNFYCKVKNELPNSSSAITKIRKRLLCHLNTLYLNPLFNTKEKLLWLVFIINPVFFEFYARIKVLISDDRQS